MTNPKTIALLGCTGSIGVNCIHIVRNNPDLFCISVLTAHRNHELLLQQCREFKPQLAVLSGVAPNTLLVKTFKDLGVYLLFGKDSLSQSLRDADYDLLVNAIVGSAGFLPTLTALERSVDVALANKETLVMGGELVTELARQKDCQLIPIDSEHSAILQCLMGEADATVEKIILTASGGPFRNMTPEQMASVTVEQALAHPNWDMGAKITIDSATMMNKGLEVIEARWLFDVPVDKIEVVIHPQSIIHSMVAFTDGSIKAQLGVPDMKVPIQLAMTWPERLGSDFPRLDFCNIKELTFQQPDLDKFRALAVAFDAIKAGGTAPAVMNAANESAVALFLDKKIGFTRIAGLIAETLEAHQVVQHPDREELVHWDEYARDFVFNKV